MELGLLNLMSPGTGADDAGAVVPGAVDADAFSKLIAQLGLGPTSGEAAAATSESLAARLAGMVRVSNAPAPDAAPTAEADAEAAGDPVETEEPIDLASLGLPPLLAALIAPSATPSTAGPAAFGQAPGQAGASLPAAAPGASIMAPAIPVDQAIVAETKAGPAAEAHAAPVELPAPLAALVSAAVPRRPAPATQPATPASPAAGEGAAPAAPADAAATPMLPIPVLAPTAPAAATEVAGASAPAPVAELVTERQLDLAKGGEWLDQLAKDIARASSGDGQLRFRLNPEHLGSLHVELTQGAAGASLRLTADSESARAIIADARPQLIAEARAQGVKIAEAHVDVGSGGSGGGSSAASGQGGHASRDGRAGPDQSYLTTWKPESVEETASTPRRSASERYA